MKLICDLSSPGPRSHHPSDFRLRQQCTSFATLCGKRSVARVQRSTRLDILNSFRTIPVESVRVAGMNARGGIAVARPEEDDFSQLFGTFLAGFAY
jgi:hypothetical protein